MTVVPGPVASPDFSDLVPANVQEEARLRLWMAYAIAEKLTDECYPFATGYERREVRDDFLRGYLLVCMEALGEGWWESQTAGLPAVEFS